MRAPKGDVAGPGAPEAMGRFMGGFLRLFQLGLGGGWWRTGSHFGVKGDLPGSWGSSRCRSGVSQQGVLLPLSQALWRQRI